MPPSEPGNEEEFSEDSLQLRVQYQLRKLIPPNYFQ